MEENIEDIQRERDEAIEEKETAEERVDELESAVEDAYDYLYQALNNKLTFSDFSDKLQDALSKLEDVRN